MRWESLLLLEEMNLLRNAIASDQDFLRIVPAWPFAIPGSEWDTALVTGGLTIGWLEDWSDWEINPAAPEDWEWMAPALVGRLEVELPSLLRPDVTRVRFAFEEDADADVAIDPAPVVWRSGPALGDSTVPKIFPLMADWAEPPQGGLPQVEVTRRQVGRSARRRSTAYYPQSPAMAAAARVVMKSRAEVAAMLRWWADMRADVGHHYVGSLSEAVRIASPASAGATQITLHDAALLGPYRFLSLTDPAGQEWVIRCLSPSGNNVPVLSPLPFDVDPSYTLTSVAILARHADQELEIRFHNPFLAEARLAWVEIPEEYSIQDPQDESRGSTIGAVTPRAWLYRITIDRAGAQTHFYRTGYERSLTGDGHTWIAAPITHSEIRRSVRLDRDEATIDARHEPWAEEFLPGKLTARVKIAILEADLDGATATAISPRWTGEIVQVFWDGPFLKATARGPYGAFDRPLPRFVMQPGCNHALFDAQCGLAIEAWTFSATTTGSGSGTQVQIQGDWEGAPEGFGTADWFALGFMVLEGHRFLILASSAVADDRITLQLDRAASWDSSQEVDLVPGCDGRAATCTGKFSNFPRFGGFPDIPAKNPSFTVPKRTNSSYGKK
jgi:uncharacterized phage protein (TIGR02218 family)